MPTLYYNMMDMDTYKHRLIYDPEAGEWICCKCGQVFSEEEAEEEERKMKIKEREREGEGEEGRGGIEEGRRGASVMIKSLSAVGMDPRGKTNFWLTGLGNDRDSREDKLKSHLANIFSSLNIPFYMAMEVEHEVKSILKRKGEVSNKMAACIVYSVLMKYIYSDYNILKRIKSEVTQDVEDHVATVIAMRFNTVVEPVCSLPLLKVGCMYAIKKFYKR